MVLQSPDDAAVWRLSEDKAIVVTTDFFTPVVDTPYEYGSIAAANSLSDVYAMGGLPFLALNIAALPDQLPAEISSEILRGGAEKAREAGVVIAGGHTVKDKEPKYGLVVIGFVDPRKMISKGGLKRRRCACPHKTFGGGVTTTALKQEKASDSDVKEAIEWMSRLNKTAGQLQWNSICAAGRTSQALVFSVMAWKWRRLRAFPLHIDYSKLPFLSGARGYAEKGIFPGGAFDNKKYFGEAVYIC